MKLSEIDVHDREALELAGEELLPVKWRREAWGIWTLGQLKLWTSEQLLAVGVHPDTRGVIEAWLAGRGYALRRRPYFPDLETGPTWAQYCELRDQAADEERGNRVDTGRPERLAGPLPWSANATGTSIPRPLRWEWKEVFVGLATSLAGHLNALSEQGWEIFQVVPTADQHVRVIARKPRHDPAGDDKP